MMFRDQYNEQQHEAARILDDVKAGIGPDGKTIAWALRTLGEPVAASLPIGLSAAWRELRAREEVVLIAQAELKFMTTGRA